MSSLLDLNTPKALLLVHYNVPSKHSNPRHTLQTQYCVRTLRRLSNPLTPCHKQSTDYTDSVPLTSHTEMNQNAAALPRLACLHSLSFLHHEIPARYHNGQVLALPSPSCLSAICAWWRTPLLLTGRQRQELGLRPVWST